MPLSALPEHLNSPEEIEANFPDDSQFGGWFGKIYRKIHKVTKAWFAFGPRCTEWWANWGWAPKDIFRFGSSELWRIEFCELDPEIVHSYTSRIQYHMKWYIILQWPLNLIFKVSYKDKFLYGYGPIHYDADAVWWLFSFFLGTTYK